MAGGRAFTVRHRTMIGTNRGLTSRTRPGTEDRRQETEDMFRVRSLATGVALVMLVATTVAFAQGPRGGGPFGGRGGRGPMGGALPLAQLNLTDAQRQQFLTIRERYREQTQALASRLAEAADKQRQAIETLPVNETLITSATQDMTQVQVDVAV